MKHATLLIINLERVYTMDKVNGLPVVFQHAFIAVHHVVIGRNMQIRIQGFWMAEDTLQCLDLSR